MQELFPLRLHYGRDDLAYGMCFLYFNTIGPVLTNPELYWPCSIVTRAILDCLPYFKLFQRNQSLQLPTCKSVKKPFSVLLFNEPDGKRITV